MKRIGIVGFGFMGNMHFNNYAKIEDAKVVAICDVDEGKLTGRGATAGNVAGTGGEIDLSGIQTYTDADKMFKEAELDAVSITLPTYLHKEYTLKALHAGLNVLCEKPMALDSDQCRQMAEAAHESGRILQIGHCIRFWPEYAKAKELVESGSYGDVKAATFRRLSLTPTWSWDNWILDSKKSGGAILDLHIHDADFVQYLFGVPASVSTTAAKGPDEGLGHAVTQYFYDDDKSVTAEGGWLMSSSFGFQMSFEIVLEKATICYDCTREPAFKLCPDQAEMFTPQIEAGDGYLLELKHFIKAISGENVPAVLTPQQSLKSVEIIEAERRSALSGEKVSL
jgi:1,5-anhydro-D-fructose reductase (1,5-anhydro-D-mannitol-forming)